MIIKSLYQFDEIDDKGIGLLPLGSIFLATTSVYSNAKLLGTIVDRTGFDANTTVGDVLIKQDSYKVIGTYGHLEYDYPNNSLHIAIP